MQYLCLPPQEHFDTSRKVPGLISDGVIGIFLLTIRPFVLWPVSRLIM